MSADKRRYSLSFTFDLDKQTLTVQDDVPWGPLDDALMAELRSYLADRDLVIVDPENQSEVADLCRLAGGWYVPPGEAA